MKTQLHRYHFDLTKPEGRKQWEALQKQLAPMKARQHHAWGGKEAPCVNDVQEVEIEPLHLFENQWNTTTSRVFDWFLQYEINGGKCARGHWLEITPEMQAARENTLKCGYCGKHYGPFHSPAPESGFCEACLDTPYLKQDDLYMTRLQALNLKRTFPPLTPEENAMLTPLYITRQTSGADSRAAQKREKERQDIEREFEKAMDAASNKHDGLLWLWEHQVPLENVIYYSHTDRFCIGWRSPVSKDVASRLLNIISEFPFSYDIKAEDKTYSN